MKRLLKKIAKKAICSFLSLFYGSFGESSRMQYPRTLVSNRKHIFIGKNVFIRKHARIEPVTKWQGKSFNPKIIIKDGVNIEQNVHITCADRVVIGRYTSVICSVVITDIDHEYSDITRPVMRQGIAVNPTEIGECCFIGAGAKIMAGVHIGEHSVIGANAVVTHDIPPYCVAAGVPAKVIKTYDFERQEWKDIGTSSLYRGGRSRTEPAEPARRAA